MKMGGTGRLRVTGPAFLCRAGGEDLMERVDGGRPDRWAILFTVLVMTFMVCLD